MISPIYRMGQPDARPEHELRDRDHRYRAYLWHQHGVAVIDPRDMADDLTAQVVINEANRIYGQREGRE